MSQFAKILLTLGILSFIIITFTKTGNYIEVESFEITDDKIDRVLKAEDMLYDINEFVKWCDENFDEHVIDCYYWLSDFVDQNEELVEQIEEIQ